MDSAEILRWVGNSLQGGCGGIPSLGPEAQNSLRQARQGKFTKLYPPQNLPQFVTY